MTKVQKVIAAKISELADNYKPSFTKDKAGRVYIDDCDRCSCCSSIRSPSRSWAFTEYKHALTKKHAKTYYKEKYSEEIEVAVKMTIKTAPLYINNDNYIIVAVRDFYLKGGFYGQTR